MSRLKRVNVVVDEQTDESLKALQARLNIKVGYATLLRTAVAEGLKLMLARGVEAREDGGK